MKSRGAFSTACAKWAYKFVNASVQHGLSISSAAKRSEGGKEIYCEHINIVLPLSSTD